MDATHRLEDAVPATAAKPSSTSSLLGAPCARADAPTRLESSENTLNSLEDAAKTGDTTAICNILQLVRRQYSQEDRRLWKPDVVRRLWIFAVKALGDAAVPEVGARACQLIEVLAQNCKSCIEGEWEIVFHEEAPKQVIREMEKYPTDLSVQSSCLRALLSMSGCMTCRSFYDKETQDLIGKSNAVSALVCALENLQQLTTKMHFETNAHKLARLAIADAVQTLHYICLMNEENTARLAATKGLYIIHASIQDNLNELTVQEHGCMLLAELAISTAISEQELLKCVGEVTNVARLQMQEKFIEVARAAVWSLGRIAGNVLHPCHCLSKEAPWSVTAGQVWSIMQGQALSMIMDMMQSCQLKNDALVKHCLDFIAVVGGEDGLPPPAIETLENFKKAMVLVYDLFIEADDVRIKAASVRTLSALARNPHISFMENDDNSIVSSDTLLRTMRTAHMCQVASERDTFCIQVFGIILLFHVNSPGVIPKSSQISEYIRHVHEAVGDIIRYIVDGGEEFFFDNSDSRAKAIEVRCCRCACHCCFIHESCTIHDVLAAIAAASKLLSLCGRDSVNFTDAKGLSLLHKLAQSGLKECLRVFVEICGDDIDYLQRTPHGATALHLARASSDATCAALLEQATECAEQAQDTISKENTDVQDKNSRAAAAAALKKQHKKTTGLSVGLEAPEMAKKGERSDPVRSQKEDDERVKAEEEYERTLAERRRQLEDMEAALSRKSPFDKVHRCSEKKARASTKDMPNPLMKAQTRIIHTKDREATVFAAQSDIVQRPQQILGSSISVGSGTNNGSPDPAAAPAGPYDDHSIGNARISAFQTRPPPLGFRGLPTGDDRLAGTWHSLFAADPADPADAVQGGLDNKWNMLSSSSGQNNHMTMDADRQSSFIQQQIWPPLTNPTRQQPQPDYGGVQQQQQQQQQSSQDALASNISGNLAHPPAVSSGIPDDDVADDTQILSWLSSEITGLIGNGPQADRPPPTEIQKSRDFQNEGVPPPPPQNAPSPYENVGESTSFLSMGTSMSPFYSGNPMAMSPYMHPAPGNFVQSHSGPWGNAMPSSMTVDPRLIPQSEISGGDGRPSVHPSRFWHTEENDIPSKHLWLGNLNTRLPRSVLKSVFEEYGPIEDVVTFPGRMYAFVNFIQPEDAQRAAKELDNLTLPVLTGNRKLVIKFRPNRKALGRVGDLMPGVANIEECNSGAIAPSISVPVLRSPDMSSSQQSGGDSLPQNQAFMESEHPQERHLLGEREDAFDAADPNAMIGSSCRHLWLGNVCVRPSKTVLFSLFSRYGPVESVRVFPGKTYAFVNFYSGEHAFRAKEALDGKTLTAVTGTKPLVVRFQREGAGPAGWARVQDNFNNIPPLQSAESAPGAYVTNNMMLPQDRPNIEIPGGYRSPRNETQRPQSLSPEEYPSLNRSVRGTENAYYDPYQTERRQRLPISEGEIKWPEGMSKDMNASGQAMEASSIGHLTRTLSAATFGKAQRTSPYMRTTPLDSKAWNPPPVHEGGFDDRGLPSSYSATLSSSHSFGGYDAKGYTSAFFHPQMTSIHSSSSLSQSHLWTQPRPQDAALSSQPFIGNSGFFSDEAGVQMSLPQEPLIASGCTTNQGVSDLDPSQGQQNDSPVFVSSAVISCDKAGIW